MFARIDLSGSPNEIPASEFDYFMKGSGMIVTNLPADYKRLTSNHVLDEDQAIALLGLSHNVPVFKDLRVEIEEQADTIKAFLASPNPESCIPALSAFSQPNVPASVNLFRELLLIQATRGDRLITKAMSFVELVFGVKFMQQTEVSSNLASVVENEVKPNSPVLLCGVAGYDPSTQVMDLATAANKQLTSIAIGSAEGSAQADAAISSAAKSGRWVLLKNVHLAPQWLVQLEKKMHSLPAHASFRLFLTTEINPKLPVTLLRSSRIFVYEPAAGVRSNVMRTLGGVSAERMNAQPAERGRVYFLLAWVHAVLQERLRYVPLGWSKHYEFNEADLRSALDTIDTWMDTAAKGRSNLPPSRIPWAAIRSLLSQTIYGGKIDNEIDQRLLESFVNKYFSEQSFESSFNMVDAHEGSGTEAVPSPEGSTRDHFMQWLAALPPAKQTPVWLGLPSHAERVLLSTRARELAVDMINLQVVDEQLSLQSSESDQKSSLEIPQWMTSLAASAVKWLAALPESVKLLQRTAERIKDPLFRFFEREVNTGCQLLARVRADLQDVVSVCGGQIKQTNHLRALLSQLNKGVAFDGWTGTYKVPKGLTVNEWIVDFAARVRQLQQLGEAIVANANFHTLPIWMGGLFSPEAFITATRQAVTQSHSWPLEQLVLRLHAHKDVASAKTDTTSFLVTGLRLEGCELAGEQLVDGSASSTISYHIPAVVLQWTRGDDRDRSALVELPLYLNANRLGLIVTVHFQASKGFKPQSYYQRGVCLLCSALAGASSA
jgi:dynein heavy chain 1, cytosolic